MPLKYPSTTYKVFVPSPLCIDNAVVTIDEKIDGLGTIQLSRFTFHAPEGSSPAETEAYALALVKHIDAAARGFQELYRGKNVQRARPCNRR